MKRQKRSAPAKEEDGEDWEQTRKVNSVDTVPSCPKLCRHDACGLPKKWACQPPVLGGSQPPTALYFASR
jgi:hypothetical protein